jgi:hypothetical protein
MEHSPTKLALAVEALTAGGQAVATETDREFAVANLRAADARALAEAVSVLGWEMSVEDATPEVIAADLISDAYEPYRLTVTKPSLMPGVTSAVARSGIDRWLSDADRTPVLWVASLEEAFETLAGRLAPWGDPAAYTPRVTGCDPRKVVRDLTRDRRLAGSLDPWALHDVDAHLPWGHWAFRHWARLGSGMLLRALGDEVEEDGRLLFRGPPVVRLSIEADVETALGEDGIRALQSAAAWVFESQSEMRPRHDLFAPEIARTALDSSAAGDVLRRVAVPALEGARIARAFGLSEQSRDSLKAMTDLRKSISEEIAKLSDTTRQIAAAVAAALFAGIGLIAARLVIDNPALVVRQAAAVIGVVLFLYVAAVIASGWQYVQLQRRLRSEWHAKIYRFILESDYQSMVVKPAASAELGFFLAAWIGGIAATSAAGGCDADRLRGSPCRA